MSFSMTIPALNTKPTMYSSSTLRTFTGKIKKGSQNSGLFSPEKMTSWMKQESTYGGQLSTMNTLAKNRSAKLSKLHPVNAKIRDKHLNLITRKTIFNDQIKRAYPG